MLASGLSLIGCSSNEDRSGFRVNGMLPNHERNERAAVASVWRWYCRNRDSRDVPFSEIVKRVQARCSGADVEWIKSEFEKRLRRVRR